MIMDEVTRECIRVLEKRAMDFRDEASFCTGLISAMGQGYIRAVRLGVDYELHVTEEGQATAQALVGLDLVGLKC
jgi:hypothetical protein